MIDKTRYMACNMNRLASDCSFTQIESVLEPVLLKIEAAAKEGKFECWIYEQDIYNGTTCRMSDLAAELRKLGYETHVGRDKNDLELRVCWQNGDQNDRYKIDCL